MFTNRLVLLVLIPLCIKAVLFLHPIAARCIELHNNIINWGLTQLDPCHQVNGTTNWFKVYANEGAEYFRSFFSEPLVQFLENAAIVIDAPISFTPYLTGLSSPKDIISSFEVFENEGFDHLFTFTR